MILRSGTVIQMAKRREYRIPERLSRRLRQNREDYIADVYAMTRDESGTLYFYSYTPFTVVRSTFEQIVRCNPHIAGSKALFVNRNGTFVAMDGGYDRHDLGANWQLILRVDGDLMQGRIEARGSKIIRLNMDLHFDFLDWKSPLSTLSSFTFGRHPDPFRFISSQSWIGPDHLSLRIPWR